MSFRIDGNKKGEGFSPTVDVKDSFPLQQLPPEVIAHILSFIPDKDLKSSMYVNRQNQDIIRNIPRLILRVSLFIFLSNAKALAAKIQDPELRSKAYGEVVVAQAVSGDIAGAKKTAAEIEKPRFSAYVGIVKVQATSGDIAGAKNTASEIEGSDYQIKANLEITKAQVILGDIAGAKDTADEIDHILWRMFAYMDITKAQAASGDAVDTKAVAVGTEIPNHYSRTCMKIANRDITCAKKTAAKIENSEERFKAYMEIAGAQAVFGDIAGAKETAAGINNVFLGLQAYMEIVQAQAALGDITGAKETVAVNLSPILERKMYEKIATIQAISGDISGVKETVLFFKDVLCRIEILCEVTKALSNITLF